MNFSGKTIWITGATSGIGRAVAIEISKHRAHLVLSGRNQEALREVSRLCKANGSTVSQVPFDLGNEAALLEMADLAIEKFKKIDGLYHFGGISQRSLAAETPPEVDRRIMEVNFFGTVALTKKVLPSMIRNGGGHIAVTSSIVGKFGFPYRSAYSASKHALQGYFESLRAENTENNIRISIIIPGRIRTNISINALERDGSPHGEMDQGQEKGMAAARAAKIICNKLRKEQKEILVGGKEKMMVYIRRFVPPLYYKLASKVKPM